MANDTRRTTQWNRPERVPSLEPGHVHVWNASVSRLMTEETLLRDVLDAQESERASRFRGELDRQRHLVAHGVLRLLLAEYASHPAESLRFEAEEHGKPRLSAPESNLSFNLSHSGDIVLIAVTVTARVGVDVEMMKARTADELNRVAEKVFALAEQRALQNSGERHTQQFYSTWSRKEAYIKGTGAGIARGLDHFHVYDEQGSALSDVRDSRSPGAWWLHDLVPETGYAGALATDLQDAVVEFLAATPELLRALR
jgi:4'-phosphopantetheinyl transferase